VFFRAEGTGLIVTSLVFFRVEVAGFTVMSLTSVCGWVGGWRGGGGRGASVCDHEFRLQFLEVRLECR